MLCVHTENLIVFVCRVCVVFVIAPVIGIIKLLSVSIWGARRAVTLDLRTRADTHTHTHTGRLHSGCL